MPSQVPRQRDGSLLLELFGTAGVGTHGALRGALLNDSGRVLVLVLLLVLVLVLVLVLLLLPTAVLAVSYASRPPSPSPLVAQARAARQKCDCAMRGGAGTMVLNTQTPFM